MKTKLFGFLILFIGVFQAIGQCVKPVQNRCNDALVFCSLAELNGFRCQTSGIPNVPDCPAGNPGANLKSTVWIAFVSQGGSVRLKVKPISCKGKGGIRVGITGECYCQLYYPTKAQCSDEEVIEFLTYTATAKTYYLFVDACDTAVCEFEITTDGGTMPKLPSLGNISGNRNLCTEACGAKYSVSIGGLNDPYFVWTLDGQDLKNYRQEIYINFEQAGTFELCVKAVVGNPQSGSICEESEQKCIPIEVSQIPDKIHPKRIICSDQIPFLWNDILIDSAGTYRKKLSDRSTCCAYDSVIQVQIWQRTPGQNHYFIAPNRFTAYIDPYSLSAFHGCYNGREISILGSGFEGKCDSSYFLYAIRPEWKTSLYYERLKFEAIHTLQLVDATRTCGTEYQANYSYKWYLASDSLKKSLSNEMILKVRMTDKYCVEISADIQFGTENRTIIWDVCENVNERLIKVKKPEKPLPDTLLTRLSNPMTERIKEYHSDPLSDEEFSFSMIPNPAFLNNNLQIVSNMPVDQIILFDLHGRKILTQKINQQNTFSISLAEAPKAGLYLVQLKSHNQTLCRKLFILN